MKRDRNLSLSVIVPMYNVARYLAQCIESILVAVEGISAEVLLIDDASTDGTAKIAQSYAQAHPCVEYHAVEHGGLSRARNFGASIACGEFIAFVDSDDYVAPHIYRDLIWMARAHDCDMAMCNVTRVNDQGKASVSGQFQLAFFGPPASCSHIMENEYLLYDTAVWNKVIRRSFWVEGGFEFPPGALYEDMPVALALHLRANRVAMMHSFGYFWRIRDKRADPSITQRLAEPENLADKMRSVDKLLQMVGDIGMDSEGGARLARRVKEKLVASYFEGYMLELPNLDADSRQRIVSEVACFLRPLIAERDIAHLSAYHRAKFRWLMDGDVERLVRLVNHRLNGWRRSHVVSTCGAAGAGAAGAGEAGAGSCDYRIVLPRELYGVDSSPASTELQYDLPVTHLIAVRHENGRLSFDLQFYQSRISIARDEDVSLQAYLYEELTGTRSGASTSRFPTPQLTQNRGSMVCFDDFATYSYDYSHSGWRVTCDVGQIVSDNRESLEDKGDCRWLLYFDFRTPVASGSRLLRGMNQRVTAQLRSMRISVQHAGRAYELTFEVDIRQTLHICCRRTD